MDPEFEKNIKKLLGDGFPKDDQYNDDELNDELEAIMNGGSGLKQTRNPVKVQSKKQKTSSIDPTLDVGNIQKMLNTFDIENSKADDDIEVDENDLMEFLGKLDGGEQAPEKEEYVEQPMLIPELVNRPAPPPPMSVSEDFARIAMPQVIPPAVPKTIQQTPSPYDQVKARQLEYKKAALKAKNEGDKQKALTYLRKSKEIDSIILQIESGENVDLTLLPPSLEPIATTANPSSQSSNFSSNSGPSTSSNVVRTTPTIENNNTFIEQLPEVSQETAAKLFNAPTSAGTIMEALQQRLQKFKATHEDALATNNSSKARRLGRIVKQYETAIKDHKAKKPLDLDSLPCPPGFPPFPTEGGRAPAQSSQTMPAQIPKPVSNNPQSKPQTSQNEAQNPASSGSNSAQVRKPHLKRGTSTIGDKQLRFLVERQKLFKQAALEAFKRKEVEQAKEYLRQAKGFDPLIEATINGLPIDTTNIPVPPQIADNDFVVVDKTQVPTINAVGEAKFYSGDEREELFRELERDLLSQIEMCIRTKEFFLKMGDAQNSKKFEQFATDSRKDLTRLRVHWKNGDNVPSFKYETRAFSCVVANSDVGTQELLVEILNGIDIPGKQEIDTYVKVEFNFPSTVNGINLKFWKRCFKPETRPEKAQVKKTKTVYDTTNPVYNERLLFEIQRESRSLARILKRHPLKLELYSKGGFLRSDTKIATVLIDMKELETKCTIHDCFPLTDGKKQISHGKLEVKIKIREPLFRKQIEEIKERWIVFT